MEKDCMEKDCAEKDCMEKDNSMTRYTAGCIPIGHRDMCTNVFFPRHFVFLWNSC